MEDKIIKALGNRGYEIDTVFIKESSAYEFMGSIEIFVNKYKVKEYADSSFSIIINDMAEENIPEVASMIWGKTQKSSPVIIEGKIVKGLEGYIIDKVFITESSANEFIAPIEKMVNEFSINAYPWGAHLQTKGSLFSWMYFNIFAKFVHSTSYDRIT